MKSKKQKCRVSSLVKFRTFENEVLQGEVKRIDHTTSGIKIQVVSGSVTRCIYVEQILEVVKY